MATKECIRCGIEFETLPVIDGKKRYLTNRKFCTDCKPINETLILKQQSNRKLKEQNEKQCNKCKLIKNLSEFYPDNSKTSIRYHSFCKDCRKSQRNKRRQISRELIKTNLSCSMCGYNKCLDALDFHHVNPNKKEYSISRMLTDYTLEKIQEEIAKCIVLCANCHRELHYNERQNEIE